MHTGNSTVVLRPLGWRDIAPVFNLIQQGSAQGHFTALYQQPRHMAGLGLQLFSLLAGRLRLPDKRWYRAHACSLQVYGGFAGFIILRQLPEGGLEIYMCALRDGLRGQGLGRCMVKQALVRHAAPGQPVAADCLPASEAMAAVLRSLGFDAGKRRGGEAARRYAMVWPGRQAQGELATV